MDRDSTGTASLRRIARAAGCAAARYRAPLLLAVLLTLGAVAGWQYREDLARVASEFRPAWLAVAFVSYLCATGVRTVRFWLLVPMPISLRKMFEVTAWYQMIRTTAPAQSGELSYPLLLQRAAGTSKGAGLGYLLLVRLADLVALSLALALGALWHFAGARLPVGQLALAAAIAVAAAAAILIGGFGLQAVERLIDRIPVGGRFAGPLDKLAGFVRSARRAFSEVTWRQGGLLAAATAVSVGFAAGRVFALLSSVGIALPVGAVLFILGATQLLSLTPLRVTAGVGIKEAGFLAILVFLGQDTASAVSATAMFALSSVVFPLLLCAPPLVSRKRGSPSSE